MWQWVKEKKPGFVMNSIVRLLLFVTKARDD
jgi:hypothetical protein